ncbi:hypothetical protein [Sporomusa sp.]|uniref:hypothetical protein n=1 Tax=Sporomusa sp. TaxID=2078658 RepID=UPI002C3BD557|nr:hypothetical protein [Sporomusa sp.]HWR43973.1 hypothetical protein [Sporomusa sp.]
MQGVQRDGGWCEPLHRTKRFRLGVAGEESERDPPNTAAKVGRKATWVATREKFSSLLGMRTLLFF